jgi:two-component system chemotaxis response regulator CheB
MSERANRAVVIGGSSGALDALALILPALPSGFVTPLAIVLHIQPGRPSGLVNLFRATSRLNVKEAEDKEPIEPCTVYVAPPNYHLLVESGHHFSLSVDDPVHFSRPAIDVLFESAADAYGPALAGVLLSGANEDGARGLDRIFANGGSTVVQDPSTAVARQMPEAALRGGRPHRVLAPGDVAPYLARFDADRLAPHSPPTEERG